jgi:SAM-dependent methyltransferase
VTGPPARAELRTRAVDACPVCGDTGRARYQELRDRLFGVPGVWGMRECRREECGLLWLDPAPVDEDLHEAYANYYTHATTAPRPVTPVHRMFDHARRGYLSTRYGYGPGPRPRLERMLANLVHLVPGRREGIDGRIMYLDARPGGRVVDVGCGSGLALQALGELGWRAEGVDFDPAAIASARAAGLRAEEGTLASQHYPDGSFDAVTMAHVIEHVRDPIGLLSEARRVLAPSGTLVVLTPNHRSLGHHVFRDRWRGLEPPRHLQVFSPSSLALAARRAGWEQVSLHTHARLAAMIWRESGGGRDAAAQNRVGRALRQHLLAGAFQVLERLLLSARRSLGEEIVLLAHRS